MLTFSNPVFTVYAVAAALCVLKIMGQGWVTVYRMTSTGRGLVSPEDLTPTRLNPDPRPEQLHHDDYVDRSRRMHRNDLENLPGFLAAGLLFVLTGPPLWLAWLLCGGFVLARAGHAWAYGTGRIHDIRAVFYTLGSLIVIYMALHVLVVALL